MFAVWGQFRGRFAAVRYRKSYNRSPGVFLKTHARREVTTAYYYYQEVHALYVHTLPIYHKSSATVLLLRQGQSTDGMCGKV